MSPQQFALAWVLAKGNDIVPIPGPKRRKYLEEDVGSLDVRLDIDDVQKIEAILPPPDAAVGARYTEAMMKMVNG